MNATDGPGAGGTWTPTQRAVAKIWEEVLKCEGIEVTDNFVDLGGDSLTAAICINRIRDAYGVQLQLEDFFLDPGEVATIAFRIDSLARDKP